MPDPVVGAQDPIVVDPGQKTNEPGSEGAWYESASDEYKNNEAFGLKDTETMDSFFEKHSALSKEFEELKGQVPVIPEGPDGFLGRLTDLIVKPGRLMAHVGVAPRWWHASTSSGCTAWATTGHCPRPKNALPLPFSNSKSDIAKIPQLHSIDSRRTASNFLSQVLLPRLVPMPRYASV